MRREPFFPPKCGTCGRGARVESFVSRRDDRRGVWVFEARCHGQTETCEISDAQMREGWKVVDVVAFRPPGQTVDVTA